MSWARSITLAAGKRLMMTPRITPAKGPLWPKSVVIVMTPEGLKSVMAQDHNADSAGLHDRYVMLSEHVSRPVDESGVYKRDDHFKHVLGGAQLQRGGQVNR